MPEQASLLRRVARAIGAVLYAYVRPWPLQPLTAVPMVVFFVIWSAATTVLVDAVGSPPIAVWRVGASVVLPLALILGAYALAWRRFGPIHPPPWWAYYLIVIGVSAIAAAMRLYLMGVRDVVVAGLIDSTTLPTSTLRVAAALLLINAVFGWVTMRLRDQVERTDKALEVAKEQQRRLVQADEATRAQVAHDLHDHIQSPLVLIGMQLEQVARRVDSETGDQLRSIADEVEFVRGERLHDVIEGLAPDYGLVGLREALEGLVRRYDGALSLTLELDDQAVDQVEVDLTWVEAVYRISEQALMNAAVHGGAQSATVRLATEGPGVGLTIVDDGRGLTSESVGLGTAITDAWAQRTGAKWRRESVEPGGVEVVVHWPR